MLGSNEEIHVLTENSSEIHYFIINSEGRIILNGVEKIVNNNASINLDAETGINEGINTIKIFAASNNVLKPFEYSKSFMVITDDKEIPDSKILENITEKQEEDYWYGLLIIPVLIAITVVVIRRSRLSTNNK